MASLFNTSFSTICLTMDNHANILVASIGIVASSGISRGTSGTARHFHPQYEPVLFNDRFIARKSLLLPVERKSEESQMPAVLYTRATLLSRTAPIHLAIWQHTHHTPGPHRSARSYAATKTELVQGQPLHVCSTSPDSSSASNCLYNGVCYLHYRMFHCYAFQPSYTLDTQRPYSALRGNTPTQWSTLALTNPS